ncbi:MAG: DUF4143 domain-containing protein [Chitinivibrionales bacterium]|nr:DUF4143 domain-containing protein [Chitinivibrionales bacterium]
MLAHCQGGLHNRSRIAASLETSVTTVSRYTDLLVDLLLVRRLQPYLANTGKRLVKSPKLYIRDSGLLHALLLIPDYDTLCGHPVVGGSWEGFVIECLVACAPARSVPGFYRCSGGAEIDLVLEFRGADGKRGQRGGVVVVLAPQGEDGLQHARLLPCRRAARPHDRRPPQQEASARAASGPRGPRGSSCIRQ